ncbi:Molybdenum cofactor biosynthesis protein A [Pantoea agglomerans]|uniref:Molybdenum cofactor biosynthesis protein A n=1 Tax=Enterobacter agglomerans TaxID=549 RepID=A0A379AIP3_ENTAG|nr:Molybdenum cofactor biosynthesis protein A [Pantoea agglomerans]
MRDLNSRNLATFLDWIRTRPIQLRFIELMETGDGGTLFRDQHVSGMVIRDQLIAQGWQRRGERTQRRPGAGLLPSRLCRRRLGLIMPYAKDFCASCNRLRVFGAR